MLASSTETARDRLYRGLSRSREGGGVDVVIAEVAAGQYGVVAQRQLLDVGLGEDAIQHRLIAGRLHLLHRGVYAVGHRLLPREGRWLAAVLASGGEAALSHYSAAALWGIRLTSRSVIDVTAPCKGRSWASVRRHHSLLPPDERTVEEGIPVTTVPRTIFDLAATESVDVVENLLRQAEYLRLYDALSLRDLVDRYPGRRGVRKVRTCLTRIESLPSGRVRSPLEERFLPFLRRHRLPRPRLNEWIEAGASRFQVDCHWPGTWQIVELDGWQGHGTRTAFRDDRARDRVLRVAGYSVTRIAWAQLDDEPEAIAADLRALLGSAQPDRINLHLLSRG
jgi:very-short-patch-repair endonuclease